MIYKEIAQDIKSKIMNKEYKANDKLPSEVDLAKSYNTSRMTIRKSISILKSNGLIYPKPKIGYFVNTIDEINSFNSLNAGSLHYLHKDKKIRTEILAFEKTQARDFLANKFSIESCDLVYHISRIRYLDDIPNVIEDIFMPVVLFPNLTLENINHSIYEHIQNEGYQIGINRKNISANFIPNIYHMALPKLIGTPQLQIENTGYLYSGECFEYSISFQLNQEVSIITEYSSILK